MNSQSDCLKYLEAFEEHRLNSPEFAAHLRVCPSCRTCVEGLGALQGISGAYPPASFAVVKDKIMKEIALSGPVVTTATAAPIPLLVAAGMVTLLASALLFHVVSGSSPLQPKEGAAKMATSSPIITAPIPMKPNPASLSNTLNSSVSIPLVIPDRE
ncbi:MAG: hypothetical protein WA705_16090 [Candidatus Ozemobacteraceae bacterium]